LVNEYYRLKNSKLVPITTLNEYKELPNTVNHPNWKYFSKNRKAQQDYLLCELIVQQVKDIDTFITDLETYYNEQIKKEEFRQLYLNNRRNVRIRLKNFWKNKNPDMFLYLDKLTFMIIEYDIYKTKIEFMIAHCYKFYKNK
jgi:hypothetical protein